MVAAARAGYTAGPMDEPTAPDHADRPAEGEVALPDAARRLGVTTESLRKRLQRGKTLRGRKVGEQWYVRELDLIADVTASIAHGLAASMSTASEPSPQPAETSPAHGRDASGGPAPAGRDATWTRADMLERELSLTRELLNAERRRADLAEQTATREQEASAELRRLLREFRDAVG